METLDGQIEVAAVYRDGEPARRVKDITKLREMAAVIFMFTGVHNRVAAAVLGSGAGGAYRLVIAL